MINLKVRVFTFPSDPRVQNSYVVGTAQGGLLPVVGTLKLEDAESVTFAQLRPRIELKDDSGMIRRSMMFQEVLAIIAASPNPHQWPHSSMQTYWFGHFANADDAVPTLISAEETLISELLNMRTSQVTGDLLLVPQTQLGPVCEACCQGCVRCPPVDRKKDA